MKIKRIKNPEELSIGQMYMYKDCGRYKRGYCIAIFKDRAVLVYQILCFMKVLGTLLKYTIITQVFIINIKSFVNNIKKK